MTDMLKVIEPKSDQINAEDLIGRDMTITITAVKVSPGTEQPVAMKFEGSEKLFRPCKTVSRIIVAAWGPDTSVYAGRSLTLFRDPSVKWAGMAVGGIRVKAISHIDAPIKLALAESKQNRKITVVQPLKIEAAQQQSGPDKAADGAVALIARIDGADDKAILDAITGHAVTVKQRAWLSDNRPELAEKVDLAVSAAIERLAGADEPQTGRSDEQHGDQFPGDDSNEQED